jgi:hypothetical protein
LRSAALASVGGGKLRGANGGLHADGDDVDPRWQDRDFGRRVRATRRAAVDAHLLHRRFRRRERGGRHDRHTQRRDRREGSGKSERGAQIAFALGGAVLDRLVAHGVLVWFEFRAFDPAASLRQESGSRAGGIRRARVVLDPALLTTWMRRAMNLDSSVTDSLRRITNES